MKLISFLKTVFLRKYTENDSLDDFLKDTEQEYLRELIEENPDLADFENVKRERGKYRGDGLVANSIPEEKLYILWQGCGCGYRDYTMVQQELITRGDIPYDILKTRCNHCGTEREYEFDISRFYGDPRLGKELNTLDIPSSIIDLVQWIALAKMANRRSKEVPSMRKEFLEDSLECIKEALKFYEPGSSHPSDESVFSMRGKKKLTFEMKEDLKIETLLDLKAEVQKGLDSL